MMSSQMEVIPTAEDVKGAKDKETARKL